MHECVDVVGRQPGAYYLTDSGQGLCGKPRDLTHCIDFTLPFDLDCGTSKMHVHLFRREKLRTAAYHFCGACAARSLAVASARMAWILAWSSALSGSP